MLTVIGAFEDQISLLVWDRIADHSILTNSTYAQAFDVLLNPLQSNQPVFWFTISTLLRLKFFTYNMFIALTLIFVLFGSYLYFKRYRYSFVYTLIFTFSAYFLSNLGNHLALMQIWIFPVFMYLYEKDYTVKKKIIVLSLFIVLASLISNYLGFFLLLFYFVYSSMQSLIYKDKSIFIQFFCTTFVALLLLSLVLYPFVKENYLNASDSSGSNMVRPYEDFFYFSSRPWYFFLHPVKNPIFGGFSQQTLIKIEKTGYFLADDYFAGEHQASFFGYFLLLTCFILGIYTFKYTDGYNKKNLISLLGTAFLLFLFTMPPYFTISSIKIYTPGYLVYLLFPIFRSTGRLSIVILFTLLIYLATCFTLLHSQISANKKRFLDFFAIALLFVTLIETHVPVKITTLNQAPSYFSYLRLHTPQDSKFVIYPYGHADDAMFWLPEHERFLVNIRFYQTGDLSSEEFTKLLPSDLGIHNLLNTESHYLVVVKEISDEDIEFFENNENLKKSWEDESAIVYEIR